MSKYKVLIVDDEKIIREGISETVDWDGLGLILSGVCEDAFDAIDFFKNDLPDIVIVDISMPGLSGLEFIEIIKKQELPTKFIILSGYGEFTYAQKAMSFGVRQYLLKPLDINKLNAALTEISRELDETQDLDRLLLDSVLKNALTGPKDMNAEFLGKYLKNYGKDIWLIVSTGTDGAFSPADDETLRQAFPEISPEHETYLNDLWVLLAQVEKGCSPGRRMAYLDAVAAKYNSGNAQRAFAWSSPGPAISLFSQYAECRKKLFEYGIRALFSSGGADPSLDLAVIIRKIKENAEKKDLISIKEDVGEIFSAVGKAGFTLEKTKTLFTQITEILKLELNIPNICDFMYTDIKLSNCLDEYSLKKAVVSIIVQLIEIRREECEGAPLPWLVEKTKHEIWGHFAETDLNLKKLCSSIVFSNPDYLGKIFHKHMQKTFHEYLNVVRIEFAKNRIIRNPFVNIYEVARISGFGDNPQYFSKVFKKIKGISPSQYKEYLKKGLLA